MSTLTTKASGTQAYELRVIKSLFSFAVRLGYLPFSVAESVISAPAKNTIAERIMSESDVLIMIRLEPNQKNRTILKLLYVAGLRVSELCALKWRDLQPRVEGGQVTVLGKGSKTRVILLPVPIWNELIQLRGKANTDEPIFKSSRSDGHFTRQHIFDVVKAAGARCGLDNVSPHWLRHAHATHSLERGAPIHLVQATLGHSSVATTGKYLHARPTDSSSRYLSL